MNSNNIDVKLIKRQRNFDKKLKILNKGFLSSDNYDSSNKPFFFNDKNQSKFEIEYNPINGIPDSLNKNIIDIYNIIGNKKKELYLGEWTIMSFENALNRYNELLSLNVIDVFDIGYKYEGMGHITMLSCDLKSHLLFYRPDGGSNDYDREYNLNMLIQNGSSNYKKFYFSEWFYNIEINID